MNWLAERLADTYGRKVELLRHFLTSMFDSELSAAGGQWRSVAIGWFTLLLPGGMLLMDQRNAARLRYFAKLNTPAPFQAAVMGSELGVLTLVFAITGLIALAQWQALFPTRRDYLALAGFPIRPRQVFAARAAAVLFFATIVVVSLNLMPSVLIPLRFGGHWQKSADYLTNFTAHAASSAGVCFFAIFAVIAVQGLLLNLLPPRWFARVTVYLQGVLFAALFLTGLFSFSLSGWNEQAIGDLLNAASWAPPVWFLGLHEYLIGDSQFAQMAGWALDGLGVVVGAAAATYLISYRRYQRLLLETPVEVTTRRVSQWSLARLLARGPRQEALIQFMLATLGRSRLHQLMLAAYGGVALAIALNASLLAGSAISWSAGWLAALQFAALFWPLAMSAIVIPGFRHVLATPIDLKANWIFQVSESQCRAEWMAAVERFVIVFAIAPIYLLIAPVSIASLGWAVGGRTLVLQCLLTMGIFEMLFYSWQQLPFACSYTPGKRTLMSILSGYLAVLLFVVPALSILIAAMAQMKEVFGVAAIALTAGWLWMRARRREGWGESKLLYEDLPAVVVDLGLRG
jgi:hypothetical protein